MLFGQYGLKGLMAYPVTTDTDEAYAVGEGFAIPNAAEFGMEPDVAEGDIYADDGVYYHARKEKGANGTITVVELPLPLEEKLAGGTYDETLKKYEFKDGDTRPTLAFRTYSQFIDDSGYRVEYCAVCDVLAVEMQGNKVTRSDGVEVNGVNIVVYSKKRKVDGQRVLKYEPTNKAELDAAEADFIAGVPAPTP